MSVCTFLLAFLNLFHLIRGFELVFVKTMNHHLVVIGLYLVVVRCEVVEIP